MRTYNSKSWGSGKASWGHHLIWASVGGVSWLIQGGGKDEALPTLGISGITGRRQNRVDLIGGTGVVGVQRVKRRKAGAGAMGIGFWTFIPTASLRIRFAFFKMLFQA